MAAKQIDYYKVLGVDPHADDRTIRSAYRQRARRYHPDVAKGPTAVRRFLMIREAYEVLADPRRREEYDRLISMAIVASRSPRQRAAPDRGTDASSEPSAPHYGFRVVLDMLGILRLDVDVRVASLSPDAVSKPRRSPAPYRRHRRGE